MLDVVNLLMFAWCFI